MMLVHDVLYYEKLYLVEMPRQAWKSNQILNKLKKKRKKLLKLH